MSLERKYKMRMWTLVLAGAALSALGIAIPGCGENSGVIKSETDPLGKYPPGPTREFINPGGDNVAQVFGREASMAERKEVSSVIHSWMRARVARDWSRDCSYLSRSFIKEIVKDAQRTSRGKATTCPAALAFFGTAASGRLVNTLSGPIDSLRVGEGMGYAQYHGREGQDWIIPMAREEGRWWVDIAAPINRLR